MKSTLTGLFILLIAVLAISLFYNYPTMLHMMPQGSHLWRQSDCMAMALNYQQFDIAFLQPATFNLQSVNGQVAGEFPLFYYIAAQFKNAAFVLRLIHTIVFIAGIVATYFIAFYFLQRRFLAIFCALFIFTSPLLIFYGNNFLSDVPALSVAFIGWAFFLPAYKKENVLCLTIAILCFAFAALLKASEIINFAMVFIFILKANKIKLKFILPFAFCLLPLSWYFYAKQYNQQHQDHYYFLSVFPIWKLSFYEIGLGAWRMVVSLGKNYFWRPTAVLIILSCFYLFKHRKKTDTELHVLIIASFAMVVFYILLFYQKMIGHEYYYVPFFIFFLFLIIGILKTYNVFHAENVFAHTTLSLLLVMNIIFCRNFVTEKLIDNLPNGYLSSKGMQDFLEQHGVTKNKIIISLPDDSPNKTLSQLKRKGYTQFNDYLAMLQHNKADYLLRSLDFKIHEEQLKPYQKDSIGNFNGFVLYKLK